MSSRTFSDTLRNFKQTTNDLITSPHYAEWQQRYPTEVVHMDMLGRDLCFKIVEETDKVPGKCSG